MADQIPEEWQPTLTRARKLDVHLNDFRSWLAAQAYAGHSPWAGEGPNSALAEYLQLKHGGAWETGQGLAARRGEAPMALPKQLVALQHALLGLGYDATHLIGAHDMARLARLLILPDGALRELAAVRTELGR